MLSTIVWSPEFSVGHPLLDEQHKKLLALCQEAGAALSGERSRAQFNRLLGDLSEIAREHFASEEQLLRACAYPLTEAHIREHREYEERLMQILILAADGTMGLADLYSYAMAWWSDHVLNSDMHYGQYLRAASAACANAPDRESSESP